MKRFATFSLILAIALFVSIGAFAAPVKPVKSAAAALKSDDTPAVAVIKLSGPANPQDDEKVGYALNGMGVTCWMLGDREFAIKGNRDLVAKTKRAFGPLEAKPPAPPAKPSVAPRPDPKGPDMAGIRLYYVSSAAVVSALSGSGLKSVRPVGDDQVVLAGRRDLISSARHAVEALDRPKGLRRNIHVWLVATIQSAGKEYTAKAEGVVNEGTELSLNAETFLTGSSRCSIYGYVTPRLRSRNPEDKSTWPNGKLISLAGSLGLETVSSYNQLRLRNQQFSVTVSNEKQASDVAGGAPVYVDQPIVAAQSIEGVAQPQGFKIVVYADVE